MKKIIVMALLLSIIFLVLSCINMDNYVVVEKYNSKLLELEEAKNISSDKDVEIAEFKKEVDTLENSLDLNKEELEQYKYLLNNLNDLLGNIYYVYQKKNDGSSVWGTGFSIEYQGSYYLITAGHAIENEYGIFKNLGFKANFTENFIYPKLLSYESDFYGYKDYAVFYSDKIKEGLKIDYDNDYPRFILGTTNNDLNVLRKNNQRGKDGECGSPAIDLKGEVVGIFRGRITPIGDVIKAIDNLK